MQRTNRFTTSTTTTTTTTTTTPTNTNRRSYGGRNSNSGNNNSNNSNNSFKFHNFIFNEDNQSFCLEEQHGNKKITVLHWKKGSGTGGGDDQSNCGLSKTSSDGVVANVSKRRNVDVKTSGSFPLPSGQGQLIMPTLSIISTTTTGTTSQSPLIQSSNALRHTSSGPSNINEMLNPYNETNRSKSSSQIEHLIRSNASSSSITTSSSSSSTSQVANWLNQSLNDLDLSNVYQQPKQQQRQQQMKSVKLGSSNRRRFMDDSDSDDEEGEIEDLNESDTSNNPFEQYHQLVKQIAERVTKLENDTNMMIQTQPLDLSTKSPSSSSSSSNVTRDHNNNNNQWTIDSILNERTNRIDDEECSMNSFVSDSKLKQRNHHHLQVPCSSQSNQWFQWDSSRIRSETTSPSALISAVNCRSPTSQSNSSVNVSNPVIVNPFLFAGLNPNTTTTNTNTNTTTSVINRSFDDDEELFGRRRTRIQRQTQPQQPPPPESSSRSKPHHYMFDTFLEKEISKILQSNSKSTIGGRNDSINHHHHHHHHHPNQHLFHHRHHFHDQENGNDIDEEEDNDDEDDIEKRIENKLRSLHREVLNNRSREMFEQNLFQSSSGSQQDHLRLHFKLDSNKNLEPFNGREQQQQQQQQKRNRSEPCLKQMLLLNNRQRRTQIKRQLEDTFACNSLVKMCNQSSIGRQSRSTNDS